MGIPEPDTGSTVDVKVTGSPEIDGLGDKLKLVIVEVEYYCSILNHRDAAAIGVGNINEIGSRIYGNTLRITPNAHRSHHAVGGTIDYRDSIATVISNIDMVGARVHSNAIRISFLHSL